MKSKSKKIVQDEFLTIDFSPFSKGIGTRLKRLEEARKTVVPAPQILGGTPVVRGTCVPVYQVPAEVPAGSSTADVLISYPSLNAEQAALAALYAEAASQRERPRQKMVLPPGAVLVSSRRLALKSEA